MHDRINEIMDPNNVQRHQYNTNPDSSYGAVFQLDTLVDVIPGLIYPAWLEVCLVRCVLEHPSRLDAVTKYVAPYLPRRMLSRPFEPRPFLPLFASLVSLPSPSAHPTPRVLVRYPPFAPPGEIAGGARAEPKRPHPTHGGARLRVDAGADVLEGVQLEADAGGARGGAGGLREDCACDVHACLLRPLI